MQHQYYSDIDTIPRDNFVSWVFPHLFQSRLPRYQAIADQYGYTLDASEPATINNEDDFIQLIAAAISKKTC